MIRTYEIDLDDSLVENSSEIFESLGSDIDSAIKIFLTQAVLRKGFPFEVAVPKNNDDKNINEKISDDSDSQQSIVENNSEENLPEEDNSQKSENQELQNHSQELESSEDEDETTPENLFVQWNSKES